MAVGGQVQADRDRSTKLRRITLEQSIRVMEGEPKTPEEQRFKEQLHLKLAANVLPRIQHHMGEEGGAIVLQVTSEAALKYNLNGNSTSSTIPDTE